jgi:hypothetical protein
MVNETPPVKKLKVIYVLKFPFKWQSFRGCFKSCHEASKTQRNHTEILKNLVKTWCLGVFVAKV